MSQLDGKQIKNSSLDLAKVNPATGQTLTLQGTTKIVQPQAPINPSDLANKQYVDGVASGLNVHLPVSAIAITAITLSGTGSIIDGWTVSAGNRILVNGQAGLNIATATNGIYSATGGAWSRATDSDGSPTYEVAVGDFVFVTDGTTYSHTGWVLTTTNAVDPAAVLVGTESQLFVQFSETGNITSGLGTYLTGNQLNVGAGSGILVGATQVSVDYAGVAQIMGGAGITASGNVLNVGAGTGITVNADDVAVNFSTVAQVMGGAGLTASGNTLAVGDGAGIAISADAIAVELTAVGGLTFSAAGAAGTLQVVVDNTSILINAQGQLYSPNAAGGDVTAVLANKGLTAGTSEGGPTVSLDLDLTSNGGLTFSSATNAAQVQVEYISVSQTLGGAGLTGQGILNVGAGTGITVNADDVAVNFATVAQVMGGAGLTGAGNVLNVGAGTGITVNADDVAVNFATVAQVMGGAGLTAVGNVLNVGAGNGITVAADSVAVGLTAVSGLTFSGAALMASVDGTTILINANGQLTAPAAAGGDVMSVLANKGLTAGTSEGGPTVSLDLDLTSNGGLTFSSATNAAQLQLEYITVAQVLGGAGLTGTGILNVGAGTGITVNADSVAIDYTNVTQTLGGAGLTSSGNTLAVGDGAGIVITADAVAVELTASKGLTFSAAGAAGTLQITANNGLTFSAGGQLVNAVDGTTVTVNAGGQLSTVVGSSQPVYSQMNLTPTGGFTNLDGQSTGLTITSTPNDYIPVQVFVNGAAQRVGNGASASVDCYFGSVAATPLAIASIVATNNLYWNAVTAGFTLSSADIISIAYNA